MTIEKSYLNDHFTCTVKCATFIKASHEVGNDEMLNSVICKCQLIFSSLKYLLLLIGWFIDRFYSDF